jgi:hypothetical protein
MNFTSSLCTFYTCKLVCVLRSTSESLKVLERELTRVHTACSEKAASTMPKTPTSLKVLLVLSAAGLSYCATWLLMQKLRRGDKASQDQAAESQDLLPSSPTEINATCEHCACESEPPGPLEGTMEPYGRHVIICR